MLIALYWGGKITKGEFGCQYSKDASYGFQLNANTSIYEIKEAILQKTRWDRARFTVEISIRINNQPTGGKPYYVKYPIADQDIWTAVYGYFESTSIPIMDIFCKKVSIEPVSAGAGPSTQNNLDTGAGPYAEQNLDTGAGPYAEQNLDTGAGPYVENENPGYDNYTTDYGYDHNQDVTSPPPEPMRRDRYLHVPERRAAPRAETRKRSCVGRFGYQSVPDPLPSYNPPEPRRQSTVDRNDVDINIGGIDEIPTKEIETGDDWDRDWDSDRLSEGDDENIMPPPIED